MPRLRRADCSGPGIRRRGRGRGFEYLDEDGNRIEDPGVLVRIRELVIPPAWQEVWICPYPHGHIQAVGTDAAGRRQYRYHDRWRERRDAEKFEEMIEFARALPRLRSAATEHLGLDGLPRERVLGGTVRLLDQGFFRIGGEDYAEKAGTYGLATMQKDHVALGHGGVVTFDYEAKGGKQQLQSIVDDDVYELVRDLKRRRSGGDELLAYKNGRRWFDIKSPDINEYIKEHTGGDFSAKDFRTWNATLLAAVGLGVSGRAAATTTGRKRAITRAIGEVAHFLGNTPAVCRASYIDPRVFDRYRDGLTIGGAIDELGEEDSLGGDNTQGPIEAAVLDLLEERESSAALEKIA